MKTITVAREIEFSEKIPGMTDIEVALFEVCKLQKEWIETLPLDTEGEYWKDDLDLKNLQFEVNIAMDNFRITHCKLKLKDE